MITALLRRSAAVVALWVLPVAAVAAAPIQRVVSDSGIEAWLVEEHTIPMVALEISFDGGAVIDPEDQAGAADFLAAMLEEGAGGFDAVTFAEAVQSTGMRLSFSAGRESVGVSARVLSGTLEEGLALLRVALMEPRFDPEPLERVRGQLISGRRSAQANPDRLAGDAFMAMAFPGDPYARNTGGTEATLAALTADDLRAAQARHLTRAGMRVGVVGAIDAETLAPLLDTLLAGLPAGEPVVLPPVSAAATGGIEVVPFPGPQSRVVFGHAGPLRDDPDFIPAFVMNHILGGGGFSSILMREVRERRGLAYGAYSQLAAFDRAGLVMGRVGTANARVAETIEVIRDQWRHVAEGGITQEQLDAARRFLTGAYPLRFDSNAAIARILVGLQRDGLGIDYPEHRNALIEAVTLEDIHRVAARWLDPDALTFVVAGEPEGLPVGQ